MEKNISFWPCKHIFLDSNGVDYYMIVIEETESDKRRIVQRQVVMKVDEDIEKCSLCEARRPIPDILKLRCYDCSFDWTKKYEPEDKKKFGINPSDEVKGKCPKCNESHWDIFAINMPHTHDWPYESIDEIKQWESGDGARNEIEGFKRREREKAENDKLPKFNQYHELQGEA